MILLLPFSFCLMIRRPPRSTLTYTLCPYTTLFRSKFRLTDPAAKKLLSVLRGEKQDVPPVWLMRQAGRYLPEYRELRAEKGGFLELVYDSKAAAEITLQPLRRFGFDGRSEERRVGKGCVGTCRSRWWPDH